MRSLIYILICVSLFIHELNAQTVTPWVTNGNQSILLEQQPTIEFTGNADQTSSSIILNQNVVSQSVEGFGFCLTQGSAEVINSLEQSKREELLNDIFGINGLGVSALRISIGASDLSNSVYSYNQSAGDITMENFSLSGPDMDHLIPVLQEIIQINPEIKILATPWTAPTWMKDNNAWIGGNLLTTYYEAYSLYFIKYLEAMQSLGINIWAITPQNEPENPFNEPSMLMSASEQTNFINNHLGPAIQLSNFNTKIIVFDHNCDNTSYPIEVLNNSTYADGAAFHLYAGDISAMSTVRNATGKEVYFTEQFTSSEGSFNGDFGWHMRNIVIGASNNWAKAIFEWNLATDSNYGPKTPGGCSDCLGAVTISNSTNYSKNVSYYIIGQIAKFVSPSAQRIQANSTNGKIFTTAFKNTDGSTVVIAYNNNQQAKTIRVIDENKAFNFSVPKKSAVTFIWSESVNPSIPASPSNLLPNSTSSSSIELMWTDNSNNEETFEIQRSLDGSSNWQDVGSTNINDNSFTDQNLMSSTTYYYRVRATNSIGNSSWSNTLSVTTNDQSTGGLSGVYNVLVQHSDKGLDVINQAGNNNANIQQYEIFNGGGTNQRWQVSQNSDQSYQLQVLHSGKCLAVRSSNNNNVVQKNCDGSSGQRWNLTDLGNGYYSLINALNQDALEVENGGLANGDNVQTGLYSDSAYQKWRFETISTENNQNYQFSSDVILSEHFSIFPNPVQELLYIKIPVEWIEEDVYFDCLDSFGRIQFSTKSKGNAIVKIPVNQFVQGLYYLKVHTANKELILKNFVIIK